MVSLEICSARLKKQYGSMTSVRGGKVSGSYPTLRENIFTRDLFDIRSIDTRENHNSGQVVTNVH